MHATSRFRPHILTAVLLLLPVTAAATPPFEPEIQTPGEELLALPDATPQPVKRSRGAPRHLDEIADQYGLLQQERALLRKNGFVVLNRVRYDNYATALFDIYAAELPLYLAVDPLLHSVQFSYDEIMAELEMTALLPLVQKILDKAVGGLPWARATYGDDIARDLEIYLRVAQRLGGAGATEDPEIERLVGLAEDGQGMRDVPLFGRVRRVDFSQFTPRGRYARLPQLQTFFRTATWLARTEFNIVSRASRSSQPGITPNPEETPHESLVALALARLLERVGVMGELDALDEAWTAMAGPREDISVREMLKLGTEANIARFDRAAAARLRAAVGDGWVRSVAVHPQPQGSAKALPVIMTLLGPRIVPDTQAWGPVNKAMGKAVIGTWADATYILGHDRALELDREPRGSEYRVALNRARATLAQPTDHHLYGAWLAAVMGIAKEPRGAQPTFASKRAFEDFRIGQAVAGYGQLRRSNVLVAGKAYAEAGCEMPHVYVDALPEVWSNLEAYTTRLEALAAGLSFGDARRNERILKYAVKARFVLRVLQKIVAHQLAGRPLPPQAARFLNRIVESIDNRIEYMPGAAPTYNGWYHDLFYDGPLHDSLEGVDKLDSVKESDFVADIFTRSSYGDAHYVGVSEINIAVFIVDTGAEPIAHVGPVANSYALSQSLSVGRLTDQAARSLPERRKLRPWARSHTSKQAGPALAFAASCTDPVRDHRDLFDHDCTIRVKSNRSRTIELELLDSHSKVVARRRAKAGVGWRTVNWPIRGVHQFGTGLRVRVAGVPVTARFERDVERGGEIGCASSGGLKLPDRCDANGRFRELERRHIDSLGSQ